MQREREDHGDLNGGGDVLAAPRWRARSPDRRTDATPRALCMCSRWPNVRAPDQGVATEARLARLKALSRAEVRVVAPVAAQLSEIAPWRGQVFAHGEPGALAPRLERRAQIVVHRPRYLTPRFWATTDGEARPTSGVSLGLFERATRAAAADIWRDHGPFDLIDAHGLLPDGWTARGVAAESGAPFALTIYESVAELAAFRDSDRQRVQETLAAASALICLESGQMSAIEALGAEPGKMTLMRPGVDLDHYQGHPDPEVRALLKAQWDAPTDAPLIVAAGPLTADKRLGALIAAVAGAESGPLARAHLRIAGDGPDRAALEAAAAAQSDRIRFVGALTHRRMPQLYGSADVTATLHAGRAQGDGDDARLRPPMSALEALSCGSGLLAVAGAPAAAAVEAAQETMQGIAREATPGAAQGRVVGALAQSAEPEAVASALSTLLADLDRRPIDHAAARRCAAARYPLDDSAADVSKAFEFALGRRATL